MREEVLGGSFRRIYEINQARLDERIAVRACLRESLNLPPRELADERDEAAGKGELINSRANTRLAAPNTLHSCAQTNDGTLIPFRAFISFFSIFFSF